jgi:hypothetical protein
VSFCVFSFSALAILISIQMAHFLMGPSAKVFLVVVYRKQTCIITHLRD